MRAVRAFLLLAVLIPSARGVEIAAPAAGPQALSLPLASSRWTQSFSGLADWLKTPQGFKTAAGIDVDLALLQTLDLKTEAGAAALQPLEARYMAQPARAETVMARLANWSRLEPNQRQNLLVEISNERRSAGPAAAQRLRKLVQQARENGADTEEINLLWSRASGFLLYGKPGEAALRELSDYAYARRIGPLSAQAESFISKLKPEDIPGGDAREQPTGLTLPRLGETVPSERPVPPIPKKSDLKIRAVTAALLVPSIVALIHVGGMAFVALTAVLAGLSLREYAQMLKAGGRSAQPVIGVVGAAAMALTVALHGPVLPVIAGVTMVSALRELLRKDHALERAALTVFGTLLLGFLPAHLALVRGLSPHGERLTLMLFSSAWLTDTTAYFFGKRWGSHRIAPVLSPKKTWEGALAGAGGAMAAVLLFWASAPAMMPFWAAALIGLIMGSAGQLSGYLNSMIKRANGVKDSGALLPGHGGVIDRFDTFILSSALVYFLLSLI